MKIPRVAAYQVDLPLHQGNYQWSRGKSVDVFDSTVVRIDTDSGLIGYGEVCPLGPVYLPSYAAGARAGLCELAPALLRNGQADQAAGLPGKKRDVLGRDDVSRDDEVTFVFTVLVIHDDDHFTLAQLIKNLFYGVQ